MIDSDRITLDQIYGCNFKRVPLLYGEMEGTNPFQINETDEDLDSDKQIPDQPKQISPTLQKTQLKPLIKTRQRQQTVHKSPVHVGQFDKHIGFRNSFYKNNNKINLASRQRVEEVKNQEIGMFTKYAQRFQLQKLQIWN
ncbi:unnamed protein product (macronuclear) [Paramecium tetraurelia]|uniref:Uncharacterized protein n=1 Tax=Paramecium tetraurelia TaxID=5888 RepID=A0D591_PARTE|nr:uncharacterized protein GSPATT00013655001 [Paramecium tetraurelia]CAK78208.1 unnamed protein product [Paramecium tetraurelia]|eukprot:XP_001445605.1 hypothetical protein (macronuclear) [Paramecium tetraurelia strain d4-2]